MPAPPTNHPPAKCWSGWACHGGYWDKIIHHVDCGTAQAVALAYSEGEDIAVLVDGCHPDDYPEAARPVATIGRPLPAKWRSPLHTGKAEYFRRVS